MNKYEANKRKINPTKAGLKNKFFSIQKFSLPTSNIWIMLL
jgi:hypothetical protein